MEIVFESIHQFLNEDLGNLKVFSDIPKEWKERLIGRQRDTRRPVGRNSQVREIPLSTDYKTLLKEFRNENFTAAIIKKDGKSKYLIQRHPSKETKLVVRDAFREYSIEKIRRDEENKKREEERAKWEAERNKSNESFNPPKIQEINERRKHQYVDSAEIGEYSVPGLQEMFDKLQKDNPNSKFELFIISSDTDRSQKSSERYQRKWVEDPMAKGPGDTKTKNQIHRYDIFAAKKRAQLDKKFDSVLEDLKKQIVDNFDNAIQSVVDDMRKGYTWNVDPKTIGEKLLKGVDMEEFKKFAEAYDAVEPNSNYNDPVEATKKLKKLGF